jgi:hypothetical protein
MPFLSLPVCWETPIGKIAATNHDDHHRQRSQAGKDARRVTGPGTNQLSGCQTKYNMQNNTQLPTDYHPEIRMLDPDRDDPTTVVALLYTAVELFNREEEGLSNIAELLKWLGEQRYNPELVFRDPHGDVIDAALWPLSLVFDNAFEAVHTRLRWSDAMQMFDFG